MKRTAFLAAARLAATATVVANVERPARAAAAVPGVPGGRNLVERRTAFDASAFDTLVGKEARIAQLYESLAIRPAIFNNIKNSLNGLQFGFGYDPERIAIAVANHGPSSAYTYSDAVWEKYRIGDFFDVKDKAGVRITKNVFYPRRTAAAASLDPDDENGSLQDTGISALQARGVMFLTCHTAVEEQARGLVAAGFAPAGMSGSDVAADMLRNLIPGAIVVPSMVAAIAVLQHEYHYSYLTIQS
jgi:intracellular sulfur oxidation DsrE/DsrF family protein